MEVDPVTRLTRGLQATQYSERQRAILETATLLKNADRETLNNGVFLLADAWRDSSDSFTKTIILKALTILVTTAAAAESINAAIVVAKVKVVMLSNDYAARALTLRLYGLLAHLVDDNIEMHHVIIESLESKNPLEYNAAIFATDKSAKTSMFLREIVAKISYIVDQQGPDTCTKLIRILSHMHRDSKAAREIQTLSSILSTTLNELIAVSCLENLASLARVAAHHFKEIDLQRISLILNPTVQIDRMEKSQLPKLSKAVELLAILCKTRRFAQYVFSTGGNNNIGESVGSVSADVLVTLILKCEDQDAVASCCALYCLMMEFRKDDNLRRDALERICYFLRSCNDKDREKCIAAAVVVSKILPHIYTQLVISTTHNLSQLVFNEPLAFKAFKVRRNVFQKKHAKKFFCR
ncbi:hypothetical protein HK100_008091 [Physocladia obscura]|uniref:Integrator complex subunit 7 N-terminal domain-containing protein n=1 Tax=Physocladia obscura TaxID=109957 RepID=A0AAD5X7X9_9FUNG|nr:hypothetical protein HK100_008091 [Physocladia obscura]